MTHKIKLSLNKSVLTSGFKWDANTSLLVKVLYLTHLSTTLLWAFDIAADGFALKLAKSPVHVIIATKEYLVHPYETLRGVTKQRLTYCPLMSFPVHRNCALYCISVKNKNAFFTLRWCLLIDAFCSHWSYIIERITAYCAFQ